MTEVEWTTTTMEGYVRVGIGAESSMSCGEHRHGKHTLVGKRTKTEGEQTQLQLQWLCHRCAGKLGGVMTKDAFIEMMVEANARMGQVG